MKTTYDLEVDKLLLKIKDKGYKRVLLQFADGLKPQAQDVVDRIRNETSAEALIWLGTCFGACDTPFGLDQLGVDLVVSWGHNFFVKDLKGW